MEKKLAARQTATGQHVYILFLIKDYSQNAAY